jgi:hypothetical protein
VISVPPKPLSTSYAPFPPERREPALGHQTVADWEQANGVVLPEPYRTFVTEISNGSSLGPAGDGGLQPLGCLPDTWPDLGPRQPGALFPLEAAWPWEDDTSVDPEDPRIDAAFNKGSIVLGSEDGQSFLSFVIQSRRLTANPAASASLTVNLVL